MTTSEHEAAATDGALVRGSTDVAGVRLAWTRSGPRGAGPTVVLAHGLTDDAACWGTTARRLALEHDVLAYDARGHGDSDRADDYTAEAGTADLLGLIHALRLDRPIVIGHSMGGVAAVLAAAHVEVTGLVLEDPAWPDAPHDGSKDVAASRRRVREVAAATEAERLAHGRARHPAWSQEDLATWSAARLQVDPDVVGWFTSWRTTNRWREHVAALTCPGLLVIGDPGAVTPAAATKAQQLWPGLRVAQVRGAGHDVRRDRFEDFWREVTGFLSPLQG